MRTAQIIVVGNEVLDGSVNDTNSGWLCRQISGRGASVSQMYTVPDSLERIADTVKYAFGQNPDLVITVGGLGPTRDDLTIVAIAQYADLEISLDSSALSIVERRYEELATEGRVKNVTSPEAIAAREKMAMFPAGGEALFNDVGAAPALYLPVDNAGILALPGVPSEMKSIVLNYSDAVFSKHLGTGFFRTATVVTSTNDESVLDAALRRFDERGAELGVYLKSRARRFGNDVRMTATLSAKGDDRSALDSRLERAVGLFGQALEQHGLSIVETNYDA